MLLTTLCGAVLLVGCGGAGSGTAAGTVAASVPEQPTITGGSASGSKLPRLTAADLRRIRTSIRRDRFVREVAGGSRVLVGKVIPSVSEGGRQLLGGAAQVHLSPAVEIEDQKLPVEIYPNQKAPPGTPTLHRFIRMSATGVGELEVAARLANGRVTRIEPSGTGYKVTKAELIGPAPTDPAYAPEPGY
jgi:hypothetical protein